MQGAPAASYFWVAHFNIPVATASSVCRVYFSAEAVHADGSIASSSHVFRVKPQSCPGDFNGNGTVDGGDLTELLADYGQPSTFLCDWTDIDQDGVTNGQDLAILLSGWGPCTP
jgi:hypothetical protein